MGGKRPDQHNIDPAEAGATDYKWGQGHHDENLRNEDKENFVKSQQGDQPMIPAAGVNPALRELRDQKMHGHQREQAEGGADVQGGTDE